MTQPEFDTSFDGYVNAPAYMETISGKRFDPLDMDTMDVDTYDIAHALSLQCRYNGHTFGHFSVARHSLWVSHEVWLVTHSHELSFIGLMHDAAEAYIGDIIRPLKHRPEMAGYAKIEEHVESVIAATYGFAFPHPEVIKECDSGIAGCRERHERTRWDSPWQADQDAFLAEYDRLQEYR